MHRLWKHHHCWIAAVPQHQLPCQQLLLQHLPQLLPSACLLLPAAHTHAQTDMHQLLCQVSPLLNVAAPSLLDRCCASASATLATAAPAASAVADIVTQPESYLCTLVSLSLTASTSCGTPRFCLKTSRARGLSLMRQDSANRALLRQLPSSSCISCSSLGIAPPSMNHCSSMWG